MTIAGFTEYPLPHHLYLHLLPAHHPLLHLTVTPTRSLGHVLLHLLFHHPSLGACVGFS
jgi:hypothetical protein